MNQSFYQRYSTQLFFWSALFLCIAGAAARIYFMLKEGYGYDVNLIRTWGRSAYELGVATSYSKQVVPEITANYPPLSITILTLVGWLHATAEAWHITLSPGMSWLFAKLPANIFDALTSAIVYLFLRSHTTTKIAITGALVYWCNPAVMYNSAFWGQIDSIYTFFCLLAAILLMYQRYFWSGILLACGLLCKIQAVIFIPFFFGSIGLQPKKILAMAMGFINIILLAFIPFILQNNVEQVVDVYARATSQFTTISSSAYNFWWIIFDRAANGRQDSGLLFYMFTYRTWGILLFSICYLYSFWKVRHLLTTSIVTNASECVRSILYGLTMVAFGFFLFNTQMHERYLFPMLTFGLVYACIANCKKTWVLYGAVSCLYYLNLAGVLGHFAFTTMLYQQLPQLHTITAIGFMVVFWHLLHERLYEPQGSVHWRHIATSIKNCMHQAYAKIKD